MSNKINLILYSSLLVFGIIALAFSTNLKHFIKPNIINELPQRIRELAKFRYYFFTIWNYMLQILFLILAVSDETSKLAKLKSIQKPIEKIRLYLFFTLVLPSTLIVISVFWSIWHIDRELIFPKIIDNFYPSWLNHTLHTLIVLPIIIEMFIQYKNQKFKVSRLQCMIGLTIYCAIYEFLYLSVYFKHGIWLYPVYNVLNWTQRVIFLMGQYLIGLVCQQIAISILAKEHDVKMKSK